MAYFGENWDDAEFPLAYLITIRTYGTWLHGDERGSIDTHDGYNIVGADRRPANVNLETMMRTNMRSKPVRLKKAQQRVVHQAIQEVCKYRDFTLYALNVKPTHTHLVVRAQVKPEKIAEALKSYATRRLREKGWFKESSPWSRGRSRRYLWKANHLSGAVDYVLYSQSDDVIFDSWYESRFHDK